MNPPNALPPSLLEVSALALSRGGRRVFENVYLRLGRQQTVEVRGPNGSGKSSLLLAIAGILRPDAGAIDWIEPGEGPDIHFLGHANGIRSRLTLAENLGFWRSVNGPTGLSIAAALDRVGLSGLGAIEAGHLSAGQSRRLALARLLVSQRRIWLLDEPTAALDDAGRSLVGDLLAEHAGPQSGAIVATHEPIPGALMSGTVTLRQP